MYCNNLDVIDALSSKHIIKLANIHFLKKREILNDMQTLENKIPKDLRGRVIELLGNKQQKESKCKRKCKKSYGTDSNSE